MKNLIFQFNVKNPLSKGYDTKLRQKTANISKSLFELYAKKYNADYTFSDEIYISTETKDTAFHRHENFYYEKALRVIYDPKFDKYDNVLIVDMDVIPLKNADNIFDIEYDGIIGVFESELLKFEPEPWWGNQSYYQSILEDKWLEHNIPLPKTNINTVNGGVLMFSKKARLEAREKFDNWKDWGCDFTLENKWMYCDGPFISAMCAKHNINLTKLSPNWNIIAISFKVEEYPNKNFLHYVSTSKEKLLKYYKNKLLDIEYYDNEILSQISN